MNIDTAIRHITVLYPDFPNLIEGATEEEIRILEELMQRELPASYRTFLSRMGRNCAGLAAGFGGSEFEVDALIAHYTDGSWGVPPPRLMIGLDATDGMSVIPTCLDAGGNDPPVVYCVLQGGRFTEDMPAALTLGEMLFRYAVSNFCAFRMKFEGWAQLMAPEPGSLIDLDAKFHDAGLIRHPASEGYGRYFFRPDMVAEYFFPPGADRVEVWVHGHDESEVEALMGVLERDVGAITRWVDETSEGHPHLRNDDEEDPALENDDGSATNEEADD